MKLDTQALRYLNATDWRILTATETGSRNHEVVPTPLIGQLAGIRNLGNVQRSISILAKANLIAKVKNANYDGYRLTYGGLDYLALHALQKQNVVYSVGNQIGIGKESDIFIVADETGEQRVLKIHRLGRVSFKKGVRRNRDYGKGPRQAGSWMNMSRLAAMKEFIFMKALGGVEGLHVPRAISHNRHQIVMEFVDGTPLRRVTEIGDVGVLYGELMAIIVQLAGIGLIHGDFNEFNIIILDEDGPDGETKAIPVLIDFPQMVSVDHANAEYYFQRDVECVKRFFESKFKFVSEDKGPFWKDAKKLIGKNGATRLDVEVQASGFSKKMARELEAYMKEHGVDGDAKGARVGTQSEDEDAEEAEEEEEEEEHDHDHDHDYDDVELDSTLDHDNNNHSDGPGSHRPT